MPPLATPGNVLDLNPLSSNMEHVRKENMLVTLSKLGERDTQQTAIDELRHMIMVISHTFWAVSPW